MRPDDTTKNKTKCLLRKIAPFILIVDLLIALAVWIWPNVLFEDTETAHIFAAFFAVAGVVGYFVMIKEAKKIFLFFSKGITQI